HADSKWLPCHLLFHIIPQRAAVFKAPYTRFLSDRHPHYQHKKAQKFSVCFAVEKTAKPATFLFHFIFTRDTEACREGHGNENTLPKSERDGDDARHGSIAVKALHQIPFQHA
ncbi:MAG: hypothetical protein ACOX9C_10015, partial [Kiritimatiellia bacterium]